MTLLLGAILGVAGLWFAICLGFWFYEKWMHGIDDKP